MRVVRLLLLLSLPWVAIGCGPRIQPFNDKVEGTVRFEGVPLVGVHVQFVPESSGKIKVLSSSAITDGNGHFDLVCENNKPGAILSTHRIIVLQGRSAGAGDDPDAAPTTGRSFRLPADYALANRTPLRCVVETGQHTYNLNLTRNPVPTP